MAKRVRNPEERARAQAKYYQKTKDSHRQRRLELTADWLKRHPDYHYNYGLKNKGLVNAKTWRYRASKVNASPSWLSEEQKQQIKLIYINCPKGCEVDHIIPLQGEQVKGLHVPWNLQYLPKAENRRKRNKVLYGTN